MAPKPTQTNPSEADIAVNQLLLSHAQATATASSWLSSYSNVLEDDEDEKAEQEREKAFLRNYNAYSETGGVGFKAEDAKSAKTAAASGATESLRRQMLGKRGGIATKADGVHNGQAGGMRHGAVQGPSRVVKRTADADSDEEQSRAHIGKKPARAVTKTTATTQSTVEDESKTPTSAFTLESRAPLASVPTAKTASNKKRGTTSYLDEILASRAAKKQRKKGK